jgi:hypothetical protein
MREPPASSMQQLLGTTSSSRHLLPTLASSTTSHGTPLAAAAARGELRPLTNYQLGQWRGGSWLWQNPGLFLSSLELHHSSTQSHQTLVSTPSLTIASSTWLCSQLQSCHAGPGYSVHVRSILVPKSPQARKQSHMHRTRGDHGAASRSSTANHVRLTGVGNITAAVRSQGEQIVR